MAEMIKEVHLCHRAIWLGTGCYFLKCTAEAFSKTRERKRQNMHIVRGGCKITSICKHVQMEEHLHKWTLETWREGKKRE